MEPFNYTTDVALVFSYISICLVIFQWHNSNEQRKIDALMQIYDINRQLITLGFSRPELFQILQDSKDIDPLQERRYLQLWLNQLVLIYFMRRRALFQNDLQESLERDVGDFMKMENMRRHWKENEPWYPASFRRFVEQLIKEESRASKLGPPLN